MLQYLGILSYMHTDRGDSWVSDLILDEVSADTGRSRLISFIVVESN